MNQTMKRAETTDSEYVPEHNATPSPECGDGACPDCSEWFHHCGPTLFECAPYFEVERITLRSLPHTRAGKLVAEIVNETQWLYQDGLASAVMAMTAELTQEFGWESDTDEAGNRHASMDECVKALQQPMTVAEVLSRLHRALDLVPPSYVTMAASPDFDWRSLDRTG